jgi:hypothetical protein
MFMGITNREGFYSGFFIGFPLEFEIKEKDILACPLFYSVFSVSSVAKTQKCIEKK